MEMLSEASAPAHLCSALNCGPLWRYSSRMANRDLQVAWDYHNATKHSYWSVRTTAHYLDWANQPLPLKIYRGLEPIRLPTDLSGASMPALLAISETIAPEKESLPDLKSLARLLYFSAGITKRKVYPGGEIYFRAAACTGALYEVELYLACGELPDLEAGVYHFSPADFALRRLRSGDWRGVLVRATAGEPATKHAPAVIICTATYWRNAWKYRARTYRHFGWDNGTILANLLAVAAALGLPARVVCGFIDREVNSLLDLDSAREVAFSMVPIGHLPSEPPEPPEVVPLGLETAPLSAKEVDYPQMRAMHEASSLTSAGEVASWRGPAPVRPAAAPSGEAIRLDPFSDEELPSDSIEEVILRRGSTRRFASVAIGFRQFSTVLDRAARGIPADFLEPFGSQLNDMYLIINAVEGVSPGAYFFDRGSRTIFCLKGGNFRREAGYLALEQNLASDASLVVFFLADLGLLLERFGNRGYRAAQLEAGILGGKLYLAAYAQRLGATGLTFYDDDVAEFFMPHSASKNAIFLVAIGKSARQKLT